MQHKIKLLMIIGLLYSSMIYANEEAAMPFTTKWDKAYLVQSADKNFNLKFGGRLMWDNAFFFQDQALEDSFGILTNGTQFRRVRFYNEGDIYQNIKFKVQLDFAGGSVGFRDVFIELKKIPVLGSIKVGQFKEPFRYEELTSSNNITFIERTFPSDYSVSRNNGVMFGNNLLNNRMSWAAGFFRNADGAGNDRNAGNAYNITTRLTGLPYISEDKSKLVHLGLGYTYRDPENRSYSIASRPEAHMANRYVSTGLISDINAINIIGTELLMIRGSFSFLGEYVQSNVSMNDLAKEAYIFSTYHAQISYFLTGERKNYSSSGFKGITPKKDFGTESGAGAWEVALRYSSNDLNSGDIEGGQLDCITLGLNWYLNPVSRIMLNYTLAQRQDIGNASIFQTRVQLAF